MASYSLKVDAKFLRNLSETRLESGSVHPLGGSGDVGSGAVATAQGRGVYRSRDEISPPAEEGRCIRAVVGDATRGLDSASKSSRWSSMKQPCGRPLPAGRAGGAGILGFFLNRRSP